MKFIKYFLSFFCTITTAIVFVMQLNLLTAENPVISTSVFWQILLSGFITSVVTTLGFSFNFRTKAQAAVASLIHFAVLCAVMVGLGIWFGWMDISLEGILSMCVSVAIVYVMVFAISYIQMKKEADELNRALKERNGEE